MLNYSKLKECVFSIIDTNADKAINLSDWICDHPELSGKEYEASKRIKSFLGSKGFQIDIPISQFETSFRATYGSNNHKYKIALLTEYDALPDIGHACGHCASGAASVLAGIALIRVQDILDIDVHVVGTPAEETDGAKSYMAESGFFDAYDMAIMAHMHDRNIVNPKFLALGAYVYNFYGKSSHASAAPWDGINAFNAAQLTFHGIDMLRQHVTPDARIHGLINNCGQAANIVPDFTNATIGIRANKMEYLKKLEQKVDNCAEAGAIATGATWDKNPISFPYYDFKCNETGTATLAQIFSELELEYEMDSDGNGSSDIGNVSYVCPSFHPMVQAVKKGTPAHNKEFALGMKESQAHQAIIDSAKIISLQVIKIFMDENKINMLKADFAR